MIHLDYRDARPIYAQIIDGFKEQISTGLLKANDKLPSVRELAAALTINPNTIQRSYRQLEAEGWIVTVPGKGCFVCRNEDNISQEIARWYTQLDEAATVLLSLGLTREQISDHIRKGENTL